MNSDPYHDIKPIHMAALISRTGGISPLCAPTPRRINLKRASWTIRAEAVTCARCRAKLA